MADATFHPPRLVGARPTSFAHRYNQSPEQADFIEALAIEARYPLALLRAAFPAVPELFQPDSGYLLTGTARALAPVNAEVWTDGAAEVGLYPVEYAIEPTVFRGAWNLGYKAKGQLVAVWREAEPGDRPASVYRVLNQLAQPALTSVGVVYRLPLDVVLQSGKSLGFAVQAVSFGDSPSYRVLVDADHAHRDVLIPIPLDPEHTLLIEKV